MSNKKIIASLIAFVVVFFFNFRFFINSCNWSDCPDFIGIEKAVSIFPNFYNVAGCVSGWKNFCWGNSFSFDYLIFDLLLFATLIVIIKLVSKK